MSKYKALLVSPDGDWVTDFSGCNSIEEVQERLNDMGSRWIFYPFHAVIKDKGSLTTSEQRIIDAAYPFEDRKGIKIKTFCRLIAETPRWKLEHIFS